MPLWREASGERDRDTRFAPWSLYPATFSGPLIAPTVAIAGSLLTVPSVVMVSSHLPSACSNSLFGLEESDSRAGPILPLLCQSCGAHSRRFSIGDAA